MPLPSVTHVSQLSFIGTSLNNPQAETWIPNSLSLVQAVICPLISSASDTFQARKTLLVGSSIISFVGAAIAPGSRDIYRLIAAQTLIGFGFASVPLAYCVPSEILPRKWRPSKYWLWNRWTKSNAFYSGSSMYQCCCSTRRDIWSSDHWSSDEAQC